MRKRCLLIFAALLICLLIGGPAPATNKKTAAKKAALKKTLGTVHVQIENVKDKIRKIKGQKRTALSQLTETQQKLEIKQSSVAANSLRLLDAQGDLAQTIKRLARTIKQLKRRQEFLATRVSDIYEGEDVSYANVVLGSADMWTFMNQAYYLKCILETDSHLMQEIRRDKESIEADKTRQTKTVQQIQGLQVALIADRNAVSTLADEQRDTVVAIEHDKDLEEKTLDELEAQSRAIEARIQAYQNTPQGRQMLKQAFRGKLSMPCSGPITSPFGYRYHPITHVYKLHTGIDIGVHSGTPIHAAADGVVFSAGWEGAYGNAVIIDHGGGVSTLYGHNSRVLVSRGQRVSRGQVIALSGSTGYSTGPHCHFEVRKNGTPVNPR